MRLVYNEKDSLSVRHNLNITSHAAARDFPQCSAQCSITSNFLFSLYPLKSSALFLIRLFRPSSSFVVCCAPPVQLQLSKNNCARLFLVEFKSRVRGESNVVIMKFLGNWVKCAYTQKHCSFAFSSMLRCLFFCSMMMRCCSSSSHCCCCGEHFFLLYQMHLDALQSA